MKYFIIIILSLLFNNTFAQKNLYVKSSSPRGHDINISVSSMIIEFNQNIITLEKVGDALDKIHLEKIELKPKGFCDPVYLATNKIECKISKPLDLSSNYSFELKRNFNSLIDTTIVTGWRNLINFKTENLKVTNSKKIFYENGVSLELSFNVPVESDTISAKLKCGEFEIENSKVSEKSDKSVVVSFSKNPLDDKNKNCIFYFNKPIKTKKTINRYLPKARIALSYHKRASPVNKNEGVSIEAVYCDSSYGMNNKFYQRDIYKLKCKTGTSIIF